VILRLEVRASRGSFDLDVTLEAPPGLTVLRGPSGSGKSTCLAIVAGLFSPREGRVELGSDVLFDSARGIDAPPEKRGVSVVMQRLALFPHLDVLHNVTFGVEPSVSPGERRRRAEEALSKVHALHLAARRPSSLSGGEAQRVALARALARDARVFLFDEPFSALDHSLRRDVVAAVVGEIARRGVPALLVTHDELDARDVGGSTYVIEHGKIVGRGVPLQP
jgi:molybdate transport system ATP-binding protein